LGIWRRATNSPRLKVPRSGLVKAVGPSEHNGVWWISRLRRGGFDHYGAHLATATMTPCQAAGQNLLADWALAVTLEVLY